MKHKYIRSDLRFKLATINQNLRTFSRLSGLLLAVSAPNALAQAVGEETSETQLEEVVVYGVRQALEDALEVKRNSDSIVDSISASDIDALPALDLGEALQALPGIQLNRDEEGRQSSISLRGLPGNFVKTTAFGQSFATPTRSASAAGGTNPFSAFEAGVFDGVTVIKAPTAEHQAGGIAGIVDKKLQQALDKKDGRFAVSLGGRYEELTENWDKQFSLQGSKHLIKDKLAVAFKLAGSDQTFRRDTMNFTDYVPMDDQLVGGSLNPPASLSQAAQDAEIAEAQANIARHFPTIDAYKTQYGLPADADVRAIGLARNVTEYSDGDRLSFTGNIEFQATDELKLGTHILWTERDLKDGTKESTMFSAGFNTRRAERNNFDAQLVPDSDTAPFVYDYKRDDDTEALILDASGNPIPIYAVSRIQATNGSYIPNNRKTTFLESSKGIFFYADYEKDEWTLNGVATLSKSENQFMNIGLDFRHSQDWREFGTHPASTAATGINGVIDTGMGNLSAIEVDFTGWDNYSYDGIAWQQPSRSSGSTTGRDLVAGGRANGERRLQFFVDGRVDNPTRDFASLEANAKRDFDIDFEFIKLDSVKAGWRISKETLENRDQKIGAPGINTANISSDYLNNNILATGGDSFFGGGIPGTFDQNSGWLTFNNDAVAASLQDGLLDLTVPDGVGNPPGPALTIAEPSGFYDRVNNVTRQPFPQFFQNNFSTDQIITAAFLMGNFSGDLGPVFYRGNIGTRFERTENDYLGLSRVTDELGDRIVETPSSNGYSDVLPSVNLSFEFTDDIILRTAYYHSLIRPNIRSANPSLRVIENNSAFNVTLPSADVKPYSAKNIDLSLEWYNREGSAVSLGIFRKEITNLFARISRDCPPLDSIPGLSLIEESTGPIERQASGSGFTCLQTEPSVDDMGDDVFKEVNFTINTNVEPTTTVTGYEFAVQQNLDFLPAPWDGFGGVFNFTKLDQDVPEDGERLTRAAPKSYNIIGYWENEDVSIRLAYNWKDDEILRGANSFLGTNDRTRKASGQLDFSGSYKVMTGLKVTLRGYNLGNTRRLEYWGFDERAVSRIDHNGRIFQLSANYSF